MKIEMYNIKVKDLVDNYIDSQENGVVAFHGLLNVRPAFQREFIYKEEQRNAVIQTIFKKFPLNVMYWSVAENPNNANLKDLKTAEDLYNAQLKFELMDGQQRTISICQYTHGDYSVVLDNFEKITLGFVNLSEDQKDKLMNYELSIYVCEGDASEKLDWFKIINIGGAILTPQERRNAVYAGPWLAKAKTFFSKNNCMAYRMGQSYLNGCSIRQQYLETAISWIAHRNKISIEEYMRQNQYKENADELIEYFKDVIKWIEIVFPTENKSKPRKCMKGLPWGIWYNKYAKDFSKNLSDEVTKLMAYEDIDNKKGIYEYLLTGEERALHLRTFRDNDMTTAYEQQKGICPVCKQHFNRDEMVGHHIQAWSNGGKTILENCQMLCKKCHKRQHHS